MQGLSNIRTVVTGSTGFVGLRTVSKLLSDTPVRQVALAIRAPCQQSAEARLGGLIQKHPKLAIQNHLDRVQVVPYDGTNIPVESSDDALVNLGADTSWTKPLHEMMAANCDPIADLIANNKMPKHVVHCSTAYSRPLEAVSPNLIAGEASFPEGKTFFSPYGESKYHAERKIESDVGQSNTCYTIVRPTTIGPSTGLDSLPRGWATDLKGLSGLFYLAHPMLGASLHTSPAVGQYESSILSVDHVANTIVAALLENVHRKSPTIEYIHAAPGQEKGLNWRQVTESFSPDMTVMDEEVPRMQYSDNGKAQAAGEILNLIGGKPYRFHAMKRDMLLKPLLTEEEQQLFPMTWEDGEDQEAYIKDCADGVARQVIAYQQAAAKKKQLEAESASEDSRSTIEQKKAYA